MRTVTPKTFSMRHWQTEHGMFGAIYCSFGTVVSHNLKQMICWFLDLRC